MHTLFTSKAPKIVADLMKDLSLTANQACGILGNIGRECGGFVLLQEVHPESGVGGYGWDQWTGVRRGTFFAFCREHGLSVDSDEGNYAYLVHELKTSEAGSLRALRQCHTLYDCTASFERHYERAGVPALDDRYEWAELALAAYQRSRRTASVRGFAFNPTGLKISLKGWRTRIVSLAVFILGMADLMNGVDIKGALTEAGIPGDKVGIVMIMLSVVYAFLRELSNTPAGSSVPVQPAAPTA